MDFPKIDDEHSLISRYAAKLASSEGKASSNELNSSFGSYDNSMISSLELYNSCTEYRQHQEMIDDLEASNRQIMEEIRQLREGQLSNNPSTTLLSELHMLKQYKIDLEDRMIRLHDGRQDLMNQLERLMATLKARDMSLPVQQDRNMIGSGGYNIFNSPPFSPTSPGSIKSSSSPAYFRSNSTSSSLSSPSTSLVPSRTRRQFHELFRAADAINEAISVLVDRVTDEDEHLKQRTKCIPATAPLLRGTSIG